MPHVSDAVLNRMLDQLPKELRRNLSHIVSGAITHQVACMGDCQGEVIAYIYSDGVDPRGMPQFRVEPIVNADDIMKLRASRKRLDGQLGFQCWCGNDSRIASQEAGSIKHDGLPPDRDGLEEIYRQLQANPAIYAEVDGVKEVDGFSIERVGV